MIRLSNNTCNKLAPWRFLALLVALALVVTACAPAQEPDERDPAAPPAAPPEEGEPRRGGSITVALEAESTGWLPGRAVWAVSGQQVARAIYDSFMFRNTEGEIVPFLAESLEPNDDLTQWTLRLRPGVRFHDGTELTAAVVKANFDEHLIAEGSNTRGALTDQGQLVQMEVVDNLTVRYILPRSNGAFPELLTGAIGMPFSIEAARAHGEEANANPVGTGPFRFVSWARDDRLVVARFEDYWQEGLPYLDEIVFRPIPDEDTRLASLLAGDIDAMQTLRQAVVGQVQDAAEQGTIQVRSYIGANGGGAIFNTLEPPVDDQRVRLGLAHGIDQAQLIDVLGGTGISPEQTQYWSDDSPWFSQRVADAWPRFDPERARELLDEYINDPNRSDGKAPGSPISVEFNCPPDPSLIELSQAYQAFWGDLGVQVRLNQVEQAAHIANAMGSPGTDPPFRGDFMINCWRMGSEADPYMTLRGAFGPVAETPTNFTNFTHPVIDENLEVLRTSADHETRFEAAENIMMLFTEQVPNLWTGATAVAVGLANDLRGWRTIPLPDGQEGQPSGEGVVVYWPALWRAQ